MVSAGFWPTVGGAERQALEQSVALARRGHHVMVLTRRLKGLPPRESHQGVAIFRLPAFGPGAMNSLTFLVSAGLWLLAHWIEWDAVHAHLAGSPALAAAFVARLLGRPALVKLGGGRGIGELATSSKTVFGRAKLRLLGALGPRFLAVVPDLADEARDFLGPVPIEVLPNGVDEDRFHPVTPSVRTALRARLGWAQESVVFLYTGRFSPEKRLPWFLTQWLSAAGPDARAALVGDGPQREEIAAIAARSGGHISVLGAQDDVNDFYAAADVFFLPSTSEGLSNALLEAMASGCAVLASRVGGTAQTLQSGTTGLLFDCDDEVGVKKEITRLCSDRRLIATIGNEARRQIIETYSLSRVIDRLETLYRGLL